MTLSDASLNAPSWVLSDAPIPSPLLHSDGTETVVMFIDPNEMSTMDWVKSFCHTVILSGPLHRYVLSDNLFL